jgi:hypothetical protein
MAKIRRTAAGPAYLAASVRLPTPQALTRAEVYRCWDTGNAVVAVAVEVPLVTVTVTVEVCEDGDEAEGAGDGVAADVGDGACAAGDAGELEDVEDAEDPEDMVHPLSRRAKRIGADRAAGWRMASVCRHHDVVAARLSARSDVAAQLASKARASAEAEPGDAV